MRAGLVLMFVVVAGPLHAAERRYAVAGFDRIALSGSPEVTVRIGLQPSVVATGSGRVLDTLEVSVVGGELRIVPHERRWNLGWLGGEQPTRVTVTLPVLRAATIEGSGSITAPGVRGPAFAAVVNGSGHIVAEGLASSQVSATINGSGTIRVAGACGHGQLSLHGSGVIEGGGLRCQSLTASSAGSGALRGFAIRQAALELAGSGSIVVGGHPPTCSVSTAGSGTARCS